MALVERIEERIVKVPLESATRDGVINELVGVLAAAGMVSDREAARAAVMERDCGRHEDPLSDAALSELQARILGQRATRYGMRRSPVFVGEVDGFTEIVHYIAPHWDDAPDLLTVSAGEKGSPAVSSRRTAPSPARQRR